MGKLAQVIFASNGETANGLSVPFEVSHGNAGLQFGQHETAALGATYARRIKSLRPWTM